MDWLNDAWSGVKSFFGGGQSDEEKRRKAEEAKRKAEEAARQKQQQKTQKPTFTVPTVTKQPSPFAPQQQDKRPTAENPFMLDINKPKDQPVVKPKVEPLKYDKSEAEQISGFYVMSPEAQKVALEKVRAKGGTPEERLAKAKDALKSGDKNKIQNVVGGDMDLFKKASDEVTAEKKKADEERSKFIGNIPILGTTQNWGAGLAAMYGKATGNKELEDRANNERNLLTLGMTTEELNKYDPETQKKLKNLQNVVTALGVLDATGAASLAKAPIITGGKQALKSGIRSQAGKQIIKEAVKQTGKQYKNNVIGGVVVGGVADPAVQAYIKDGEVDWTSVPSSMLQGGLWAAALPEFSSKQKLVQKLQAGDVLTPDESKLLNQALRDAEGKDIPEAAEQPSKSYAPLDESTQTKIQDLRNETTKTPQPEGTTRLYQMTEGDITSPNYFDNIEQLANYINGRSQNGTVRFVDVPSNQAQRVAGAKGEAGVFEIKPDEGSVEGQAKLAGQADEAQEVIDDVQTQAAQQAEGGSNNRGISVEEVMQTLRERNRVYNEADPETRAEINARASQKNPDDVTLDSPYSREAVYTDLTGMGLTPDEIKNLTQRYGMTAQDWRAVMNATRDTSNARTLGGLFDSQIRKVLNKQRVQRAAQPAPTTSNPFDDPRFGVDRAYTEEVRKATAGEPVTDGGASRFIETPQGTVDTTTGEIIDTPPSGTPPVDLPPAGDVPPVDAPRTTSVYENDIKDITDYIESLMGEADKVLQDNGSSWGEVARKVQAANRNNTAPELTDVEARMYKAVLDELDETYSIAQQSGRAESDNRQEWYLPQAKEGSVRVPETMEDIYNTGFGYDQARKNAIELEDLDYGFNPVVDYVVRGRAAESLRKQTIFENYRNEAPDVPIEQVEAATELRYANDQNINTLTENPKADPDAIDTVGTQAKVAETLGIQRVDNNAKLTRGLNVRDALDSAGVLGDGFNQYRRAQALSQNFETPQELFAAVRQSPAEGGLGLTHITRERASKIVERLMHNIDRAETPEHQEALMANAIRALSKANIDEMLLKTNFTDPKLAKLVNGEYNRMAIGFNKATSTANKVGTGIRRVMNSSMRGFNLNSALTEMTDVVNAMHIYGKYAWSNLNPQGTQAVLDRWGQSGIVARMDNPDKAAEVFDALGKGDKTALKRLSDAANTTEEKLALYRYAENYKAAVFLKSAEDYWNAVDPSLQGTALTNRVLDEFDKNMLPLDHFSRVFKSDNQAVKMLTQYLDWNILNTRQQARNLVGANDSGIYRDMSRGGRISRNLAANLMPRIAIGMARGVPIITTIGVLDPLGLASQDYSGIQEKNPLDELMSVAGVSPLLSLITGAYFNYRQDEETAKNYEGETPPEDARGNATERTLRNVEKMLTPYGGQIGSYDQLLRNFGIDFGAPANGRGSQAVELMDKGYSENKNGRVQYLAPENPLDVARGWLMGKGQTQAGREYSGTPDIFSVMAGDASLADLFTSNPTVEAVTGAQGDYIRPVVDNEFTIGKDGEGNAMTANFNTMIKNAESREEQEAILEQARAYNAVLDDFRKQNPEGAEAYDKIMSDDDLVSPEYWREIVGTNSEGSINLDIFKMIGDRKKQLATSLGAPYDPMYDLPDDQARSLLQMKATATGDDLALKNILYKSDWYNQYVADRSAYYDSLPEQTDNESRQSTERVKQWNQYDKQLNSLSMLNTPDLQRQFPYNAAYKAAEREYEAATGKDFYGTPEAKAWWGQYGSGKKAEDEALDAAKLEIINQMRVIEGHPPMNADQYAQATEVASTSGSGGGSGGGGGGGSREFSFIPEFYSNFKATDMPTVGTKPKAVAFNPNTSVGRRTNSRKTVGARSSGRDNGGYSL
jgi:hypothetical protein